MCMLSIISAIYIYIYVHNPHPFYLVLITGLILIFNIPFLSFTLMSKILKTNISVQAKTISTDLIDQEQSLNDFTNYFSNCP
jgi:hypothetical protein